MDGFGIELPMKVGMSLKKDTQPRQKWKINQP